MSKKLLKIPQIPSTYHVGDDLEIVDTNNKYKIYCKVIRVENPDKEDSEEDIKKALRGSILKFDEPEDPTVPEEDWEIYRS